MGTVIGDIAMSVDGFVRGPGTDVRNGLGPDAEGLHAWALESQDAVDRDVVVGTTTASGAVVVGRRTFDTVKGPDGWNDELGYGADQDGRPPFWPLPRRRVSHYERDCPERGSGHAVDTVQPD